MRAAIVILVAGLAFPSATRADDPPQGWTFTGHTQAATTEVRARVTGYLTRLAVREGDMVAAGDLLAEIDPQAYRLDLEAAKARLIGAEARLKAAQLSATNARRLLENNVISSEELELKAAEEGVAEAALMVAKVEVERAQLTLSWTQIVAPRGGRVSEVPATEGGLVTADQTHLLTVVAADPLYVSFQVPEEIFLRLRHDGLSEPGKLSVAVGFALDEGYPHAAEMDLIGSEVDPRTAHVRFRATIPNPKGLLVPGMAARVRLAPAAK